MDTINDFANFDYKNLSNILNNLSPLEFGALGCVIGLLISIPLNNNDLNTIGNFFELVGQVMLTVQAQGDSKSPQSATINDVNNLKTEMNDKINTILKMFYKK